MTDKTAVVEKTDSVLPDKIDPAPRATAALTWPCRRTTSGPDVRWETKAS